MREGWIVIVITHRRLTDHPLETIVRVLDALHRRGHERAPRFPAAHWRPYFQSRGSGSGGSGHGGVLRGLGRVAHHDVTEHLVNT